MIKRFLAPFLAVTISFCLTACGGSAVDVQAEKTTSGETTGIVQGEKSSQDAAASADSGNAASASADSGDAASASADSGDAASASAQGTSVAWPEEFSIWGIPVISNATVTLADNRSVSGGVMTQGVNAIVNLKDVSKADFDAYCAELEKEGFVKSPDSLADVLMSYDKTIEGGVIKMILSYTEDTVTISANNSAAEAAKNSGASVSKGEKWPEAISGIPEFTKATYKETVDMGGNMFAISYLNFTESDLEWYRAELKAAGFTRQEVEDSEGYMKMTESKAYSVGFAIEGETLQLVAVVGTY